MTLWPDQIAYPPRGLSRDESARYVGVSNTTFDRMVHAGWMPRPKRVFSRLIWDRLQLDAAFTDLSEQQANPLDKILAAEEAWERKYEARKGRRTASVDEKSFTPEMLRIEPPDAQTRMQARLEALGKVNAKSKGAKHGRR
ncbi:putative DNA-binding transcriptional regulator AlpA [Bradyrhizobium sp. I1.8.5]|uniref:helix-turn-helix transcriptional regulator n=1 Tax=Bradyrhizobium sp. I1.8.5 TaxID=3156365 RepID=UPI003399F4DB